MLLSNSRARSATTLGSHTAFDSVNQASDRTASLDDAGPMRSVSFAAGAPSAGRQPSVVRRRHASHSSSEDDARILGRTSSRDRGDSSDTVFSVNQRAHSLMRESTGLLNRSRAVSGAAEQADFSSMYLPPLSYHLLQEFGVLDELRVQRIKHERDRIKEVENELSERSSQSGSPDAASLDATGVHRTESWVAESLQLTRPTSKHQIKDPNGRTEPGAIRSIAPLVFGPDAPAPSELARMGSVVSDKI